MSKEVAEEYLSSLADLTVNSKPLINMLTMLADENVDHAPAIVEVIENHIQKVSAEVKLPILYLIDSIIKNVSSTYVPLFTQNIVNIFVSVFEKVDEKTRLNMYKLRQTWNDVFPARKLYALDLRVKDIDNAWPLTTLPPSSSIHLNPKFLSNKAVITEVSSAAAVESQKTVTSTTTTAPKKPGELTESEAKETLLKQKAILIELQKKKLELELMQAKIRLQEQQSQAGAAILGNAVPAQINEELAKLLAQKALLKPKAVVMPPSTDPAPKLPSLANTVTAPSKAKITPANTQIIEAVKSRDPRLARQMQQTTSQPLVRQPLQPQPQSKGPLFTAKEQEILSRQLAMLKTAVIEQAAQVAPAPRLGNDTSVKSHITINVDRTRDRNRLDSKTNKKQSKDNINKSDSSSSFRNKSKLSSPRGSKSSPKTKSSRDNRISSPKRSRKRSESPVELGRTPTKNERSLSPVSRSKLDSKWSKNKSSPRKSSKSSRSFSPKRERDNFSKSGSSSPKVDDKSGRRNKKKGKRDDSENDYDVIDVSPEKSKIPPVKKDKSPACLEVKTALPLKEKSPVKASSPKKEPAKSPPEKPNQKTEDVENIPDGNQIKPKNKDKKKDKSGKSEFSKRGKKSDGSVPIGLELIESSPSPEPPPPPIISRTSDDFFSEKKDDELSEEEKEKKEVTSFKDLKGAAKGRNYIRRNREPSTSPQKEVTGDVDHRITGPPEKQPRLLFQDEKISDIEKSLVNVSGKDVDLRLLNVGNSSPGSKRLSTDAQGEEPPKKKNKTEVFDELFGNEDVDLRQMAPVNLNPNERLPSPPPPPVISNGPPTLQVAAIAPLIAAEVSKLSPKTEEVQTMDAQNDEHSRDSFDSNLGRYRRAKKPEAEIKPMSLSSQLELEIAPRKDSYSDASDKDRRKNFRERGSPRGELDRLGRPLLYNKLPNDPRARRESLVGSFDNRDTDMRRFGLIDRENDNNINVNMIVAEAEDQLRNGTMSVAEYNELLKQVIHVNEVQKMREAQNKSRQETRRIQYHHRSRRSPPGRFGPGNRNSPPFRHEDERRDRRPFNDIDERLPMPWRGASRNDPSGPYNRLPYAAGARSAYDVDSRNYDMKPEIWEDERSRIRRAQLMEDFESEKRLREAVCTERTHDCVDVPEADESVLKLIAKDPMKSINIDGTPRDIRFYGDTAVVMLSWDEPKRISFEDGLRRVAINDQNFTCALNHDYTMVMIAGNPHRIRLGAPTREFYIDGDFYEVHFGGPPVQIEIDGRPCFVQLEGPPPQVKIGEKRTDLVCGRINMIVDATAILPLYLDAKPQRLDLLKRPYVFRFVDSLKTLLVNEKPVEIQFGGGCRQIFGYGNLHFIRLSTLPTGVTPGVVKILNMENINLPSVANAIAASTVAGSESPVSSIQEVAQIKAEPNVISNSQPQTQGPSRSEPLDILTSLLGGTSASEQPVGFNYQVESQAAQPVAAPVVPVPAPQPQPGGLPLLGGGLNINDLFQRLVATGIVPTTSSTSANQQPSSVAPLKPVTFKDPNTLKERQPAIINQIYSGIQCSSCGVRFAPEATGEKYSRHLDWHFRQNRREKDAARKGQSRKWYYDLSDWIQFEEIEDLEERAQSLFEIEGMPQGDEQVEQEEVKSVPAPSGDENVLCELCRDQFDIFYNEEKEEWHLKPCVLVEDKYYHPFCYDDLINMPEEPSFADKTGDSLTTVKDESITEESKPVEDEEMPEEPKVEPEENVKEESKEEKEDEEMTEEIVEEEKEEEPAENVEEVVKSIIDDVVNSVILEEELEIQKAAEEERIRLEEAKEKEIEVLEDVSLEQKKNIIAVDLIETLDEEDDIVYQRKTPSPILLIPPSKIKQEPVDEMESPVAIVDQTYTSVVSSIDGNVEMIEAPQIAPTAPSKIKITFNKPIATEQPEKKPENNEKLKTNVPQEDEQDPEPLPLKPKKPKLAGRELKVVLPTVKGTEVSGLCSIM